MENLDISTMSTIKEKLTKQQYIKQQQTLDYILNMKCQKHSNNKYTFVCSNKQCIETNRSFMCNICLANHNNLHSQYFIPYSELFNRNAIDDMLLTISLYKSMDMKNSMSMSSSSRPSNNDDNGDEESHDLLFMMLLKIINQFELDVMNIVKSLKLKINALFLEKSHVNIIHENANGNKKIDVFDVEKFNDLYNGMINKLDKSISLKYLENYLTSFLDLKDHINKIRSEKYSQQSDTNSNTNSNTNSICNSNSNSSRAKEKYVKTYNEIDKFESEVAKIKNNLQDFTIKLVKDVVTLTSTKTKNDTISKEQQSKLSLNSQKSISNSVKARPGNVNFFGKNSIDSSSIQKNPDLWENVALQAKSLQTSPRNSKKNNDRSSPRNMMNKEYKPIQTEILNSNDTNFLATFNTYTAKANSKGAIDFKNHRYLPQIEDVAFNSTSPVRERNNSESSMKISHKRSSLTRKKNLASSIQARAISQTKQALFLKLKSNINYYDKMGLSSDLNSITNPNLRKINFDHKLVEPHIKLTSSAEKKNRWQKQNQEIFNKIGKNENKTTNITHHYELPIQLLRDSNINVRLGQSIVLDVSSRTDEIEADTGVKDSNLNEKNNKNITIIIDRNATSSNANLNQNKNELICDQISKSRSKLTQDGNQIRINLF